MNKSKKSSNKSPKHRRPNWDEYFIEIMHAAAKRATCDRGRSACVFVKENQVLVTGYVGSPTGFPHCDDVGHQIKKLIHKDGTVTEHCMRTVHAEQNAICQAAKRGVSLEGSTLYVTMAPCRTCTMLLINIGVKRIVAENKYHAGGESEKMLKKAGIKLEYLNNKVMEYPKRAEEQWVRGVKVGK